MVVTGTLTATATSPTHVEIRLGAKLHAILPYRSPGAFRATLRTDGAAAGAHRIVATAYRGTQVLTSVAREIAVRRPARPRLSAAAPVRTIAFYLPQFHPIPENDLAWGSGFTEWTNVSRARPLFHGHEQPRLPGEMGFYDLRLPETRATQAHLAAEYGIDGFCYYHYWFGGKRVLDRPFDEVLASGSPDFPFCLCYANENWTRRWDGGSAEIILEQRNSVAEAEAFIHGVIPAFRDPRYIRVEGRPLFLTYRPDLLADSKATVAVWRRECERAGVGDPYLLYVQSFAFEDPAAYGFDGAVEFPPAGITTPDHQHSVSGLDERFRGSIFSYEEMRDRCERRPVPEYDLFRGVMPGWDNTARRGLTSWLYLDSSPEAYRRWLEEAAAWTARVHPPSRRLLFVNAWNEWGEGAHLEPTARHGRLYLEATRAALRPAARPEGADGERAPLVSVIVPCFNHERYVARALESVLDQTLDDLEVIVVDDGSTDASVAAIQRLLKARPDARVRLHAQANQGAHAAINAGLARARGAYLAILNSDDFYAVDRLEIMIAQLTRDGADFAFSRVAYADDEGRDVSFVQERPLRFLAKQRDLTAYPELVYALLDFNVTISSGNFVFSRALYERLGPFEPLLYTHDLEFALRAARSAVVTYVDQSLYHYRLHPENASAGYEALADYEVGLIFRALFHDGEFTTALRRRDPDYYERFIEEHGLAGFLPVTPSHGIIEASRGDTTALHPLARPFSAARPRLIVTSPMKCGSTYTADALRRYFDARKSNHHLVDYDWLAEHSITSDLLTQLRGTSFSINLHVLPHDGNLEAMKREHIVPIVLWRNLADVIVSYDDHVHHERYGNPNFFLADRERYLAMERPDRYDYLIDAIVPWNLSFYLAWRRLAIAFHPYERLAAEPQRFLEDIVASLGLEPDPERLAEVLRVPDGVRFNVGRNDRAAELFSEENRARLERIVLAHPQRHELAVLLWELPWPVAGLRSGSTPHDGSVVAAAEPAYFVSDGVRHRIADASWIASRVPALARIHPVSAAELERIPEGTALL